MLKQVTVYDYSGKLVHKAFVKKDAINLQKDFGMAGGLYVVRVNEQVVSEKD
jgi:hypothetical protein